MSVAEFRSSVVNINDLETNSIRVIQEDSYLSWNSTKKHPDIRLVNAGSGIYLTPRLSGYKSVFANASVIIGTDIFGWSININQNCTLRAGLALPTHGLTSSETNDVIFEQFISEQEDRIVFLLDLNNLVIETANETTVIELDQFIGQIMHPWVSAIPGSGLYTTIKNYKIINVTNTDKAASINTITNAASATAPLEIDAGKKGVGLGSVNISSTNIKTEPGEDFSATVGTSGNGFKVQDPVGDVLIDTVLQVNNIEPTSAQIVLGGGANSMVINNTGNVIVESGEFINSNVKSKLGGNISLIANSGGGINVSSGGIVTFDTVPRFNRIQSVVGNNLTLKESNDLGINITDTTGIVTVSGAVKVDSIDSRTTSINQYGVSSANKVDIARSGINTEVKGNLNVTEGVDVIGNITVTGTVNGIDINATATGSISIHSDININGPVNNEILQYNNGTGTWVNRDLATAGITATSHTHAATNITDFSTTVDARITTQKGNINGLAELNSGGTIPISQISVENLEYKGTWNSTTNIPALISSTGIKGYYYVVSASGTTNLDGITEWQINDWVVYNGATWEKIDNSNSVVSVAGYIGAVALSATDLTDVTNAGSGAIITGIERTQIGTNNTNATGTVTVHSDVTDAGSGAIITVVERAQIGTNNTNATGTVTVHSDVTDAGSGAIITVSERSTLTSVSTTYLALLGNTMTGILNMNTNNITNMGTIECTNLTTGTITATVLGTLQSDAKVETNVVLNTGVNAVTLSSGTSLVARTYDIQDQGAIGSILVIPTNSISLVDDISADAATALDLLINGADKTAGTGDGGNLILRGGTSLGGTIGNININSKLNFIPQTEPVGVAGDVYYDSGTNKLRVHNGTLWVDMH